MSLEYLGWTIPSAAHHVKPEGVSFAVPYGEQQFDVVLGSQELDRLLATSVQNVLSNKPLHGYDFRIQLPDGELPLFIGVRDICVGPHVASLANIAMTASVVTQSMVYEHRGILKTVRERDAGLWRHVSYEAQPPLKAGIFE